MSATNWATIWKVTVEEGSIYEMRRAEMLFTSERSAKAFEKLCWDRIKSKLLEVYIEEVEVAKTAEAARFQAYPFHELRDACC